MHLVLIQAFAETASFRLPETHTFHKTLPLPSYTSCMGLLGAALGYGLEESQQFVEENKVRVGVGGRDRGTFKDLWKYRKVKSGEVISDVLLREYVVDLSLGLVYGAEDKSTVQRIAQAFNDPVYALTAGHSDSLLVLCSIELMEADWEPLESVHFCAVPLDMTGAYQADKSVLDLPLTESIRAPQVFNLPVRFSFEGERRTIAGREFFTYIGHPIQVKEPIEGFSLRSRILGAGYDKITVVPR